MRGGRAAPLVLVAVLASLAACVPAADVEPLVCVHPEAAVAELGAGDLETGFLPVEDGSDLQIVLGPQGLHMVVVSVRLQGFEMPPIGQDSSPIEVAIRHEGGVVGGALEELAPTVVDTELVEFVGLRAVFAIAEIKTLDGELADVAISIEDGCGRDVRVSRKLKLTL